MVEALLISPFILGTLFIAGWWHQQKHLNAGWVDVLWAFGVALTGIAYCVSGSGDLLLRCTVAAIYGLWFGRLGLHLARRVAQDPNEDARYAAMRQWAGSRQGVVFFFFYLVQASWVWLFTLPAWLLSQGQWPGHITALIAVLIVVVACAGESLADHQLQRFKKQPKNSNTTCRTGLWRYSRHPNYFFEWCHWFAYPILALNTPNGDWLWLAPAIMFLFLYFITGIPFTEQQALSKRGDDYREYQRTTSMFFPWPPKSPNSRNTP